VKDSLGEEQRGIFANEFIAKGEKIWTCKCADLDLEFTRDQLFDIIRKHPKLEYFVRSFSYMLDDDLYALPQTYLEGKNNDECAYFNHSCSPNIGYVDDAFADNIVAIRDILPNEELVCHYGLLETESSLIYGLECKCGSPECTGVMSFDFYRDPEFVEKYYDYATPYLKKKANEMREKWYSTSCYVKRMPNEYNDDLDEWDKTLYSLKPIKKGELVATFLLDEINESTHYLRQNSSNPNCLLVGRDVYANQDIPAETELTLYYHGILL